MSRQTALQIQHIYKELLPDRSKHSHTLVNNVSFVWERVGLGILSIKKGLQLVILIPQYIRGSSCSMDLPFSSHCLCWAAARRQSRWQKGHWQSQNTWSFQELHTFTLWRRIRESCCSIISQKLMAPIPISKNSDNCIYTLVSVSVTLFNNCSTEYYSLGTF